MEMVEKQQLKLKMKFLLSCNIKIVVLWRDKNLVGIFFGGRRLSKARADNGILLKLLFAIKDPEQNKLLGVFFHSSQPNL